MLNSLHYYADVSHTVKAVERDSRSANAQETTLRGIKAMAHEVDDDGEVQYIARDVEACFNIGCPLFFQFLLQRLLVFDLAQT